MVGVGDDQLPHLFEELLLPDSGVVTQCVGHCPELWIEAVPEVMYSVAIAGEEVFTFVVSCGSFVVFILRPA